MRFVLQSHLSKKIEGGDDVKIQVLALIALGLAMTSVEVAAR
jgi:hypothetical protein